MTISESTKTKALMVGKNLLQKFGFAGFSFQDIADALHLRKQSLYVHFKSKEILANDLVEEYRSQLKKWAETVEYFKPEDQIGAWFACIYKYATEELRCCSITALASDYNLLPDSTKKNLNEAFFDLKKWFINVIEKGQNDEVFRRDLPPNALAEIVLALAFGSQQMARLANEPEEIKKRQNEALSFLKG